MILIEIIGITLGGRHTGHTCRLGYQSWTKHKYAWNSVSVCLIEPAFLKVTLY